jgi:hypothetical protein
MKEEMEEVRLLMEDMEEEPEPMEVEEEVVLQIILQED